MTDAARYPLVPYGVSDFAQIRADNALYVDKTRFIPALEEQHYLFLHRPPGFGKTCLLSMLESYHDRTAADRFDALFGGTDIGAEPTPYRNRYMVLRFDLARSGSAWDATPTNFDDHCIQAVRHALARNRDVFSESTMRDVLGASDISGVLTRLFLAARGEDVGLYVIVDDYDDLAFHLAAHDGGAERSRTNVEQLAMESFFSTLKYGATEAIERILVAGTAPVDVNGLTGGFNIGTNISLSPQFNEMVGFTETEVADVLRMYRNRGALRQDVDEALDVMREWYDGYRFSEDSQGTMFNTDMVLYYLRESISDGRVPRRLIDRNVRIDYGKLRHLLVVNRQLNGNFDILRQLAAEEETVCEVQDGFPLAELSQPENFTSLLHFFGLLSIRGVREGETLLGVPNQTVKQLLYGYLRDGFRDVGAFSVDWHGWSALVRGMANRGEWRPAIDFLRDAVARQTGIRDYIAGEKVVQGFLAAYLGSSQFFQLHSERELGKDYADLFLEPFVARYPDLPFGYVVELEYLRRSEPERMSGGEEERKEALSGLVARRLDEAKTQLRGYLADACLAAQYPSVRFIGIALVFHGWELVARDAVEADSR